MVLVNELVACICEGAFERAVVEILLNSDSLEFRWEDLLEGDLIELRSSRRFSERYLNREYKGSLIRIVRILDSKSERFNVSFSHQTKISRLQSFYTRPEVEILIIISEDCYDDYIRNHHRLKPSIYCKTRLGLGDVKRKGFVRDYYRDPKRLIDALKKYKMWIAHKEPCIYDLIKESMR